MSARRRCSEWRQHSELMNYFMDVWSVSRQPSRTDMISCEFSYFRISHSPSRNNWRTRNNFVPVIFFERKMLFHRFRVYLKWDWIVVILLIVCDWNGDAFVLHICGFTDSVRAREAIHWRYQSLRSQLTLIPYTILMTKRHQYQQYFVSNLINAQLHGASHEWKYICVIPHWGAMRKDGQVEVSERMAGGRGSQDLISPSIVVIVNARADPKTKIIICICSPLCARVLAMGRFLRPAVIHACQYFISII